MKQLITILFVVLLGSQQTYAQAANKLDSFRTGILPKYSLYFNQADLTDNGQLNLSAAEKYILLASDEKKAIIGNVASAWRDSLIIVHYGSRSELWGWGAATGNTKLLDIWDRAASPSVIPVSSAQKVKAHPFFCYFGGQLMGDSQKSINLSINTRVGFFLLLNRWDLAATVSAGRSGNADATSTGWSNVGVMSRVHFPIKKTGFSPNIGAELTVASFGETSPALTPSLILGISWFVGIGRLDIGMKIGDITSGMGGYTMYPGARK